MCGDEFSVCTFLASLHTLLPLATLQTLHCLALQHLPFPDFSDRSAPPLGGSPFVPGSFNGSFSSNVSSTFFVSLSIHLPWMNPSAHMALVTIYTLMMAKCTSPPKPSIQLPTGPLRPEAPTWASDRSDPQRRAHHPALSPPPK